MNYQLLQQKYMVNTYPNRKLTLVKGDGVYLFDQRGEKYLDMMSNYGVNIFGYNHPDITKRLSRQLKLLTNLHGSFTGDTRALASQRLIEKCGTNYAQVYWSNSGSEAVETALKFTALTTGKKKFIAAKNSYHGKTLGALSATGGDKYRKPFEPLIWEFIHIPYGNSAAVNGVIDINTAAVIVEPIQGEAGVVIPPQGYLQKVREMCNKYGVLLILDEIQTGSGRTGSFLASQAEDMHADILCLGKGLAGGLPVGATITTREVSEKIQRGSHTSTFGGNPLVCAGVLATLELLSPDMLKRVDNLGTYFRKMLQKVKTSNMVSIRGKGLMIGVELQENCTPVLKRLQENKILAIPAGDRVVRFLPPYIIEKEHIELCVKILKKVFTSCSSSL